MSGKPAPARVAAGRPGPLRCGLGRAAVPFVTALIYARVSTRTEEKMIQACSAGRDVVGTSFAHESWKRPKSR